MKFFSLTIWPPFYPYFGTHDGMSAPLIKYDLKHEHLEVKKVNSAVDRYVVT